MSGPATHVFTGELDLHERAGDHHPGLPAQRRRERGDARARGRRGRSRHRQQLRGHQRGGAPDPPGDPQGQARAARRAGDRHRLRGADRAGDVRGDARSRAGARQSREVRSRAPSCRTPERVRVSDIMAVRETAPHLVAGFAERARAFVEVQNGCDHRCTFCIIPYGRGNSRSVPAGLVVERIKALVDEGFREVVLTGVDVTSYGPDLPGAPTLGQLIERILRHVPDAAAAAALLARLHRDGRAAVRARHRRAALHAAPPYELPGRRRHDPEADEAAAQPRATRSRRWRGSRRSGPRSRSAPT